MDSSNYVIFTNCVTLDVQFNDILLDDWDMYNTLEFYHAIYDLAAIGGIHDCNDVALTANYPLLF